MASHLVALTSTSLATCTTQKNAPSTDSTHPEAGAAGNGTEQSADFGALVSHGT